MVFYPGRGLEQLQADLARLLRCQVRPVVRIERHDDAMFAVRADADIGPALARNAFYGGPPRTIVFDGFVVTEVVGRAPTRTLDGRQCRSPRRRRAVLRVAGVTPSEFPACLHTAWPRSWSSLLGQHGRSEGRCASEDGFTKLIPNFFTKSIPLRRSSGRMELDRFAFPPDRLEAVKAPAGCPPFRPGPLTCPTPPPDMSHWWDEMVPTWTGRG